MNPQQNIQKNTETWDNLKQAITGSTGFEKWKRSRLVETNNNEQKPNQKIEQKIEQKIDQRLLDQRLIDELVTSYLRETLETLAY